MQIFGLLYRQIWMQLPFHHFNLQFICVLSEFTSQSQYIHNSHPNPGREVSSLSFLYECYHPEIQVSSSLCLQEKVKRDSRKQAPGRSYSKDSFLTCSSPPLNSESSCYAVTKDDSCSVDDRSTGDSLYLGHTINKCASPDFHCLFFFLQATGSR